MSALKEKTGYLFENVWTIPNLLSFIRILLVPAFAVLFMKGFYVWAVFVLALSGLSDFFDGKIARRFNQISELGKMLDPIADKLTQATIAVCLFITFLNAESKSLHAFAWVFLLFIVKELFMLIGGGLMIAFGIKPGAAEIFGKAATMVFYIIMIGIIAFGPEIGAFRSFFEIPEKVMMVLVVISVIMTFAAFASYMPATHKQVKERFSPEGKEKARQLREAANKEKSKK